MDFSLPLNLDKLQNDRLRLVPFELCPNNIHELFYNEVNVTNPGLWLYFPVGPFPSLESYLSWYDELIKHNPIRVVFAILLKKGTVTKRNRDGSLEIIHVEEGTFAGTCGLNDASLSQSSVEIAFVLILPKFQQTFVNSNACCLLLKHLLDPVDGGNLGLRRVQWQSNSTNQASMRAAQRLGFKLEGIMRWARICSENKKCISEEDGEKAEGLPKRDAEGKTLGPGRHNAMFALCWDVWLDGGREHVLSLLQSFRHLSQYFADESAINHRLKRREVYQRTCTEGAQLTDGIALGPWTFFGEIKSSNRSLRESKARVSLQHLMWLTSIYSVKLEMQENAKSGVRRRNNSPSRRSRCFTPTTWDAHISA